MNLRRSALSLMLTGLLVVPLLPATAQSGASTGRNNGLTDVPGIEVGHYERTDDGYLTGTTVIYAPNEAVGGVDVRGGGPGTRETDLLDPRNLVQKVNAIVLSGGSAYGIDAAHGTMQWLEDRQEGYPVGFEPSQIVPIVPSAILFDLGRGGRFKARPDHDFGYQAAEATATGPVAMGNVGAGAGASAGGIKGGIGTASVDLGGGLIVGAIVAINAAGQPFNPDTCELYGAYLETGNEFGDYSAPTPEECQAAGYGGDSSQSAGDDADAMQSLNTTIGVVATNFPMTKAHLQKMAGVAHDGMARAIRPVHTLFDGDTVFALSTGQGQIGTECQTAAVFPVDTVCTLLLNDIFAAGADAFSRAVVHAMLNAETTHGITSYCDTFPSACDDADADEGAAGDGAGGSDRPDRDANPPAADDEPAPQRPDPANGVPGGGVIGAPGAMAATGLHSVALALLALTSLAVGTVLVRQRRQTVNR